MSVTIYHNPDCGTSRNVLAILEAAGAKPDVVAYLDVGWKKDQLLALFAAAGLTPKTALRVSKSPAEALGLTAEGVEDADILAAMLEHPVLVNRPIVVTPKGTRLCRPSEVVLDLLDRLPPGPMFKEDGEMLINAKGERVG